MWQDMGLYWAYRNDGKPYSETPKEKSIEYATIKYGNFEMRIACRVFDDGIPTNVCCDEIDWHKKHGAEIFMGAK